MDKILVLRVINIYKDRYKYMYKYTYISNSNVFVKECIYLGVHVFFLTNN